ncbi:sortase [Ningiella sp. W23]|uniref:sortase n=1 Tax=Ningiella sp. W23 TaxID=3023715 RepID=UPI003756D6E1
MQAMAQSMTRPSFFRRCRWLLMIAFLLGMGILANGMYTHAKALLAQYLMEVAFEEGRKQGHAARPWSWSDARVTARIHLGEQSHYVFDDHAARNLAFGPGLMSMSDLLGSGGHSVVVAHRDTHFSNLDRLNTGDQIMVEHLSGTKSFTVIEVGVISAHDMSVLELDEQALDGASALTLISCYPFNTVKADPSLRYAVRAISSR